MNDILTKQQAADLLQCSERLLAESIRDGKLKASKVGKRIVILKDDLIEFIKANRYKGDS
ncbi:MAG: helix-turn-helix domain-containing protein [Saprospiraceae bacterium]|nr:helix-turn-helix domain-containing protein [Saprospiraceae bacterium]